MLATVFFESYFSQIFRLKSFLLLFLTVLPFSFCLASLFSRPLKENLLGLMEQDFFRPDALPVAYGFV